MDGGAERAVVSFEAPHGTDCAVLREGDSVEFGRGGTCSVRFGYAPVADTGLARVAGRFVVAGGRVFVESTAEPGHRAIEIHPQEGPPVHLGPSDAHSPGGDRFAVVVRGQHPWKLKVALRPVTVIDGTDSRDDPPTERVELCLTERHRAVLDAYCAPLISGKVEPATHREVAESLNYHPNTVRELLYEVWTEMFTRGIQMPDVTDKRVAVVDAARAHGLVGRPR